MQKWLELRARSPSRILPFVETWAECKESGKILERSKSSTSLVAQVDVLVHRGRLSLLLRRIWEAQLPRLKSQTRAPELGSSSGVPKLMQKYLPLEWLGPLAILSMPPTLLAGERSMAQRT